MPPSNSAQQRIYKAALQLFAENGNTQVSVSDLAEAAGVARGTIYNHVRQPEALFESVAADLANDMNIRISQLFEALEDPAARLSTGIRLWLRRAHSDPQWGRFLIRFAFNSSALQQFWAGQPVADLAHGIELGRYRCRHDQLPTVIAMVAGTVLSSVFLVLEGHRTWRDAGADAAELVLIALGLPREEARALATSELPIMVEPPSTTS